MIFIDLHGRGFSSIFNSLPLVLVARATGICVLHGIVDTDHDVLIFLLEGNHLDDLVHLVPHLRGLEIVARRNGRLASSSLDAAQLLLISSSKKKEAHSSSHVVLAQTHIRSLSERSERRPASGAAGEKTKGHDRHLQSK